MQCVACVLKTQTIKFTRHEEQSCYISITNMNMSELLNNSLQMITSKYDLWSLQKDCFAIFRNMWYTI